MEKLEKFEIKEISIKQKKIIDIPITTAGLISPVPFDLGKFMK